MEKIASPAGVAGIFGLILGSVGTILWVERYETEGTIPKRHIADCAEVERIDKLRQTSGIATFTVEYEDGEFTNVTCANAQYK